MIGQKTEGMLSPYRVLDLTDEKGWMCGKLLGDLGADVIKIEPPRGDPGRNIGPFYHDEADPEKSLFWFAFNTSKRGITLDIEVVEGQKIFKRLVKTADFVIESFPVDYMDKLGLGYQLLAKLNPRIIMTSITPYGQTGEWKHYKGTDLTVMATGSIMVLTGEPDGPPVRLNPGHACCLAGSNAALATLLAHYHREISGEGQYVDVSMHECVVRENHINAAVSFPHHRLPLPQRMGMRLLSPESNTVSQMIYPCKDGHISWLFMAGRGSALENRRISEWMDDERIPGGLPTDTNWASLTAPSSSLGDIDWASFGLTPVSQADIDKMEARVAELFSRYTKRELEETAMRRGVRVFVVNNVKELVEHKQLNFREFFVDVEHPELATSIKYPGHIYKTTEAKAGIRFRAPLIGEHNKQVYQEELGFSKQDMIKLERSGVI